MYLQHALSKEGYCNVSSLYLGKNPGLKLKAGIFIGDALLSNPEHCMEKLSFKNVKIGADGLKRVCEALNKNTNITKVHLGILTNLELMQVSRALRANTSLAKLKFQECKVERWEQGAKDEFIKTIRNCKIPLRKVKF